jgi:hypothetical protein
VNCILGAPQAVYIFCNEFCADDAEEARFQSHHRAERKANNLSARASTWRSVPVFRLMGTGIKHLSHVFLASER